MGLVKTRRLAAMHLPSPSTYAEASSFALCATEDTTVDMTVVRQRAILLRQGYGGLKFGTPPLVKKGVALPPHLG